MKTKTASRHRHNGADGAETQPILNQTGRPSQGFNQIIKRPIALSERPCRQSVDDLNQLLADTITLRDLYKKHHWQVSGHTFYQLHLLFDKHYGEQAELVDEIAERIMMLGGVSVAMAADVAELSQIPRPPKDREEVPVQISRLLEAHEIILEAARATAKEASNNGDEGTNDLCISQIVRTNEMQVWFVSEHVVDTPTVRAR
jgi:starvation-inducible DNA-binding protein